MNSADRCVQQGVFDNEKFNYFTDINSNTINT